MPKRLDGRGKTREREGQITRDMVIPGVTTAAVRMARERIFAKEGSFRGVMIRNRA